jgi:hypothetical protein
VIVTLLALSGAAVGATSAPKKKPTAVMVILDISGSMNTLADGRTVMWWADAATVAVMKSLHREDYIGVLAVDTKPYLVVPLQHPLAEIEPMITRITAAGGGILIHRALLRAEAELAKLGLIRGNVVLFSAAFDAEEMCAGFDYAPWPSCPPGRGTAYEVAVRLKAAHHPLSVVAWGLPTDSDVPLLQKLAEAGGGGLSVTRTASELSTRFIDAISPPR